MVAQNLQARRAPSYRNPVNLSSKLWPTPGVAKTVPTRRRNKPPWGPAAMAVPRGLLEWGELVDLFDQVVLEA
jgi:hypothetical protein